MAKRHLAFAILALLPPAIAAWVLWIAPVSGLTADRTALAARDFTLVWAAGQLALDHAFDLLVDPTRLTSFLRATFGAGMPNQIWPYPPTALLLAAPLSRLSLGAGFLLYTVATPLLLWCALRSGGMRRFACLAVLLSPAMADSALTGQNGALTAALLVGGLLLADRRPITAGLLLGALVLKPQLGLLLPICLLAGRRWTTLAGAAVSATLLAVAAACVFGPESWISFLSRTSPALASHVDGGMTSPAAAIFASAFMSAQSLGAGIRLAAVLQGAVLLACAGLAARAWAGGRYDVRQRTALTVALSLTACPWVHSYDMPALAAAIVILLETSRVGTRPLLGFAWFWPGALAIVPIPTVLAFLSVASVGWLACQPGPRNGEQPA